jgi:O-antigen/teichoic acid export membrane protein
VTAPDRPHPSLRSVAVPTAVVAVPVTVGSALLAGWPGLWAALLGTAVVVLFFGLDLLLLALVRGQVDAVGVAVLGYVVKLVVVGGLLLSVRDAVPVSAPAFVLTTVLAAAAWLAGHVRAVAAQNRRPWRPPADARPAERIDRDRAG